MNEFEKKVGEMNLTDMLKEDDKPKAVETIERNIKILTISAIEYVDSQHIDMYHYNMVGVIAMDSPSLFYGFLPVGCGWEKCPEGTEAVVAIKCIDRNHYFYGTAMIRKK